MRKECREGLLDHLPFWRMGEAYSGVSGNRPLLTHETLLSGTLTPPGTPLPVRAPVSAFLDEQQFFHAVGAADGYADAVVDLGFRHGFGEVVGGGDGLAIDAGDDVA